MIPISVIVVVRNEERHLARCLASLSMFDEVIVVDSNSTDKTCEIAQNLGATIYFFSWDGAYPKKRQWCLNNIQTKNEMIFFVDADEVVPDDLQRELQDIDFSMAGYFVRGAYVWREKILRFGLKNNKLALLNKRFFVFPIVDDLDVKEMGEIEGHYQPVLKPEHQDKYKIGQLRQPILHYAYDDRQKWTVRHKKYAKWEAEMIKRRQYPDDPVAIRQWCKCFFRWVPARGFVAFLHSYIWCLGFLDGLAGYDFACTRKKYYDDVRVFLLSNK